MARTGRGLLAFGDMVDQGEHRLLDELDQALEHLRLAGEMPVERGLADTEAGRQSCRRDALGTRLLQHLGQRLQDLHAAFARLGALAGGAGSVAGNVGGNIFGGGAILIVLHGV